MSKWFAMQQLVDRMPGGKFIGTQWRDEKLVEVTLVDIDYDTDPECREPYSFQHNVIIAAVNEFGLNPDVDNEELLALKCPPLVAEMLIFWADESSWQLDS